MGLLQKCEACGLDPVFIPVDEVGIYHRTPGELRVDGCMKGLLPNVVHACCGHGKTEDAYVVVSETMKPGTACSQGVEGEDFYALRGQAALDYIQEAVCR